MTEDKARHYAEALAQSMGITFYVVRGHERGFLPVHIPSANCEIFATVKPPSNVDIPHCRPSTLGELI